MATVEGPTPAPDRCAAGSQVSRRAYAVAGEEPSVESMLADPVTKLLMRADGIGPEDVRAAVAEAAGDGG